MAIVVLGGLFTSTALTLLVIPALYAQFGKWLVPKLRENEREINDFVRKEDKIPVKSEQ